MPDTADPPDASTEVALAVRNLMPGLRRHAVIATTLMGVALGVGVVLAFWAMTSGIDADDRLKFGLFALIVAALGPVVEKVTRIEDLIGRGTRLYAATSNGTEMHVALTHSRNLFRIGGLFPSETDAFADVRTAMLDLTVPLTLAKALIEAEEIAMAKVKGA